MKYLGFSEILACFRYLERNEISQFQKEFAGYIGCKYALATSYGRTALYLALRTIGVEGKEVMVPAFTCSVVRDAIVLAGAKPIFIDTDPLSLNMILSDARQKLTNKTVAIIFIHYYGGICSKIEEIQQFAKKHDLVVIEDCAHSLGAMYGDKKVGNFGDMSVFSLTKNALNFGGGMFCTNNRIFYERAKDILKGSNRRSALQKLKNFYSMLNYGYKLTIDKIVYDRVGNSIFKWWLIDIPDVFPGVIFKGLRFLKQCVKKTKKRKTFFYNVEKENTGKMQLLSNLRMRSIVASVGRIQLKKMDQFNVKRIKIARALKEQLPNYYRNFWKNGPLVKNVYSFFPLWFEGYKLELLIRECKSRGLKLRKSWPAFQEWWQEQDTENIRKIRDSLLLFELNPDLKDAEVIKVAEIIKKAIEASI